ncbi:hypothetical protein NQ317_002724 [Molorchus minor]|uniref:RHD domain-containing protein n=1 Tax=Molorchus minor TaxID=1323400 RepID=A0ABQ9K404_9CUCU|nr:hypothetical protein NQ317_002724 [Molorchus minor]
MILHQNYNTPLLPINDCNMNSYSTIPTPPSSNEDSPQPVYFVASPTSSSFHAPDDYEMAQVPYHLVPRTPSLVDPNILVCSIPKTKLQFVEQPTDKFRFRYKSEMAGTHGSLTGANSDKSRKQTYPSVELINCTELGSEKVVIRCSIYQINHNGNNLMPHAHRLIMKRGKEEHDDPHDLLVGPEEGWRAVYYRLQVNPATPRERRVEAHLELAELVEDPLARLLIKGLAENESKSINLNIVCLRFDAYIKRDSILHPICEPIFSHPINNLKSALTGELKIVRIDRVVGPATGNTEIFIFVERVTKKNIRIRFFELDDNSEEVWSGDGKFNETDVHHQYAIAFKTPKYHDEYINEPVKVFMELVRLSDEARSEPREFKYMPSKYKPGSKRPRNESYSSSSYTSSAKNSEELLPIVINNLNLGNQPSLDLSFNDINEFIQEKPLSSEEYARAISDMDSNEFRNLFELVSNEYSTALDAPVLKPTGFYDGGIVKTTRLPRIQMDGGIRTATSQTVDAQMGGELTRRAIKLEVSMEDRLMASRTFEELNSFAKTTSKFQDRVKMVTYYLGEDNKTNALHVFICLNNVDAVSFLLKLLAHTSLLDLVNVKNSNFETALQLAVCCQNVTLIKTLMVCKAKVGMKNDKMNTALHTAIEEKAPLEVLELLLADREHEKVKEYIDATNSDGNTALLMAVENKNMMALRILCGKGADVNQHRLKDGFTPLRVAIDRQHLDAIKYLLSLKHTDPDVVDNNLDMDIVKDEIDEDTEEEMDYETLSELKLPSIRDEPEVKLEKLSSQELEQLYKDVKTFTPQHLDEMSEVLNESGEMASHDDTLWEIRNFLESLDESRAVEIMDSMVQTMQ